MSEVDEDLELIEALSSEEEEEFEASSEMEYAEEPETDVEVNPTDISAADVGHEEGDELQYHAALEGSEELAMGAEEFSAEGTELEGFESAEIEETEFLDQDQIQSIVESVLFATDKPQSISVIKQAFKGTNVRAKEIRQAIAELAASYADPKRGFELEEVNGGFQLRTKVDNMNYLKGMLKVKPFKLSGPALEVLSIVAYKQPMIKSEIDDIRGVESGHLLRALMEKRLVAFAGKSDLPGKPMTYETTRKFLEIFGLRNLKELPSLAEIDDLIPEGIGAEEEKRSLGDMTDELSEEVKAASYSEGEEELGQITDQLANINTSSEFFEQEKARLKAKKEAEKAQDIRDAIEVGEEVAEKDRVWLERYDQKLAEEQAAAELEASSEVQTDEQDADVAEMVEREDSEFSESGELDASEQEGPSLEVTATADDGEMPVGNEPESSGILTAEEMMEFSADPVELTDVAGEPETDLETATQRFDSEASEGSEVGRVNVEDLAADLAIFDEDEPEA